MHGGGDQWVNYVKNYKESANVFYEVIYEKDFCNYTRNECNTCNGKFSISE